MCHFAIGQEAQKELSGEEWVAQHTKAAEEDFAEWKATGIVPEKFIWNAVRGERRDLAERVMTSDRMEETEIQAGEEIASCVVSILATIPLSTKLPEPGWEHRTVWRRITKERFEIWTPMEGRLFDLAGKLLNTARVPRSDGWGREWYGAFLADGRWVTTDLAERDDRLTFFSPENKKLKSIKGDILAPASKDENDIQRSYPSIPLIAWARSDKTGKAWIVSVGSEFGRGVVKVSPDGKWEKTNPWKECLPQQLGTRGMYTSLFTMSDDGELIVSRNEPSHGIMVGWPSYDFPDKTSVLIPSGGKMGVLPAAWAIFVNPDTNILDVRAEDREREHVWFFDAKGKYQRWIKGRSIGASPLTEGVWIQLPDDTALRIEKGYKQGPHLSFSTKDSEPLHPIELHDDVGIGIFRQGDQLLLGKWEKK